MKNLFIGIDFSKEKIDATVISAIGLVEQSARVSSEFKTTTSGYRQFSSGWKNTPTASMCLSGFSVEKIRVTTASLYATISMVKDTTCGWRTPNVSRTLQD